MASLLDIIGAAILAGMVILIIFGVISNLNQTLYTSTFSLNAQLSAIEIARNIEYDFYKMGYDIPEGDTIILAADSNRIKFKLGYLNPDYSTNITQVSYFTGLATDANVTGTLNPRDIMFFRKEGNAPAGGANLGVTRFNLTYYDSNGTIINIPFGGLTFSQRQIVKAIKVKVNIESPEPVDTGYIGIYWEKLIYPRNL